MAKNPRIIWRDNITKELSAIVGEKAVNLSRLKELEIKTPKFFVVSVDAFKEFFSNIEAEVERELEGLTDDFSSAKKIASNIKSILINEKISEAFQDELFQAYKEISNSDSNYEIPSRAMELIKSGRDLAPLTLQLSPTQHLINFESIPNVIGITNIVNIVKELWTRIFSAKSLYFMAKKGLSYTDYLPAIILYRTMAASKSGDLFSVNPLTNKNEQIYVQSMWGMLISNFNNPSTFILNKSTKQIEESNITRQVKYSTKKSLLSDIIQQELPVELQTKAPLATVEFEKLVDIAVKVETLFKFPQHIEWLIGKEVNIVNVEPITHSFKKPLHITSEESAEAKTRGIAIVAKDFKGKLIKPNTNLISAVDNEQVLALLNSDDLLFETMLNSAGIISPASGLSSHLAINCREFNIPCVILVKNAFQTLDENQDIEVINGNIFVKEPVNQEPTKLEMPDFLKEKSFIAERQDPAIPERSEVLGIIEPTIDLDKPIEQVSIDEMIFKLNELEKYVTNKVYEEAEKRREGIVDIGEKEQKKIRILQELEWDIRNIKKKLEELRI